MGPLIVLDTNAVLYMLAGRLARSLPPDAYAVSVISEIELLSFPSLSPESEQQIRELLDAVDVIELDADIKKQAILVRRAHRLKLPDAIIAATAITSGAELATNDDHFKTVTGLRCRGLNLIPG
jgi:hypothetical protein